MAIELSRPFFDNLCRFSGWNPHPAQDEALTAFFSGQRFLAPVFGRRSGKTDLASHVCNYSLAQKDKLIWAVAPTYQLCGRLWDFLLPLARKTWGRALKVKYTMPQSMSLPWGTRIEFKSAESPDSMIGAGIDLLVWDEAAPTKGGGMIWQQQLRPTLADKIGQCLMITTPRGHNWFHDLVQRPEWWMRQYPSHCNPFLPPDEMGAMKQEMDTLMYQQEVLAQFVAFVGMVYSMFSTDTHVIPYDTAMERTEGWDWGVSVDPGLGNPCSIGIWRSSPVNDEDVRIEDHQASGMLFDDVLAYIKAHEPPGGFTHHVCDVAGRQRSQETGVSFVGWMRERGITFTHGTPSIADGVNQVRGRLRNIDGQTRLWFSDRAKHGIKAMLNYHYPEKGGEEPVKDNIHDHAADEIRYYITGIHKRRARAVQN